jgi:hypothetical protein
VNGQTTAPIQLDLNSTHGPSAITDANANVTDAAIRIRPEIRSSGEDSSQETSTPSSFESSQDFVTRRRAAFSNDGGNDSREHFVFPDPLSRVTERRTSSAVIGEEPTESSSSENIIIEAKLAADLCGSPRQMRAHKGKGIAGDSPPEPQEPIFLPLLKEDSHFPRQPEREKQTHKSRSNAFYSKLASLNENLTSATGPEAAKQSVRSREAERNQKTLRHLRLQTLIQSDHIKTLKLQTQELAAALKRLQGSTAREIRNLEENSEIQRENSDRLVGAWEGMRRELLELKVRMMQQSPFFDPCNSNLPSMPGETIAGQGFSRPPPVSHWVDPNFTCDLVRQQYWDHDRESHIMQNPQGCRWHYCSVCWSGGERGAWFE